MTIEEKKKYDADRQRKYRRENKEKVRKAGRKYYKENPEKFKERKLKYKKSNKNGHLKRNYGITLNEYNLLLQKQNYKCAICGSKNPRGFSKKCLSVDHNHKTGKVRGLLCQPCNLFLGLIKDDKNILAKTIKYLEEF